MFHIPLPAKQKEVDYSNLKMPVEDEEKLEGKTPQWPNEDGTIPKAPDGFFFHRIKEGDSLLNLSLRFGVSQSRLRKFNREACFGHQLGHMEGKLLLVPLNNKVEMTIEALNSIEKSKEIDEQLKRSQLNSRPEDDEPKEPDEEGKYNLRKALQYYAVGLDDHRANFYLGEANWSVKQALKLYREDNIWDKQNQLCKLIPELNQQQAKEILEMFDNNLSKATKYCKSKAGRREINEKAQKLLLHKETPQGPPTDNKKDSSAKTGCMKGFLCTEQGTD